MSSFENARIRANPAYRAIAWNRLTSDTDIVRSPEADSFGVLMARDGSDLPPVAIDCDTALLFLSLQESGPPPNFVFALNDGESDRILRRLLFDSVLEIEYEGRFVSGADATGPLGQNAGAPGSSGAQLSLEALQYGAALGHMPAGLLALKLYSYNRRPATGALRARLADRAACYAFLGLSAGETPDGLDRHWSRGDEESPWLVFTRRQPRRQVLQQPCKLYVGLALEELADCLPLIVAELTRGEALQFKIGSDLGGLLRPDKFVAYFQARDALLATAQALVPIVTGRALHAVPFTAEITPGGALSWGADPKRAWLGGRLSWRQWICEKLAAALVAIRDSTDSAIVPWEFALERLRLEGIDSNNFAPTGAWSGDS